ncbi:lipopolysaccharide biosynthesis protein [Antarcticirhabdus aurantiaca]|uniref:Lipopolysaccharide biosynthesis protein n=1 Tax=Antarcticirhabdus aurantiaca TaxID=2606717 RepID=A0ACD4NQM2_9HYPH|nr:lipopolysaccharide biosynthesis protein [Antarcticirhabdus aurantiaca]WAJ29181.1 lipopolysaccharide biosynthesis protein [Jeongeuplla avenae]
MSDVRQAPERAYGRLAFQGTVAIGVAQFCKVVLQLVSLFALSRILSPVDFGLVAAVTPIVAFVTLVQDLGLQQTLVQTRSIGPEQISRLFWINIGVASLIALGLVLVAPLLERFYGDPRLPALFRSWAIPLVASAAASHHIALLNRDLRFRELAFVDISVALITTVMAVLAALALRSYWAIWMSVTAGSLMAFSMAATLTGWRPMRPWVGAETRHLLRFGVHVGGTNIMSFLWAHLDKVIVAKAFGPVQLGLYDLSYKLQLMPSSHVVAPLGRIVAPILGRLKDDASAYRDTYLTFASAMTWLLTPGILAFGIAADDLVPLLFGEKWSSAAPIFAWLTLAGSSQILFTMGNWLFISQHRTGEMLGWNAVSSLMALVSFLVGLHWGLVGLAASFGLISLLIRAPLMLLVVGRTGPVAARDLAGLLAPVVVSAILAFALVAFLDGAEGMGGLAAIALSLFSTYGILALVLVAVPSSRRRLTRVTARANALRLRSQDA